MERIWRSKFDRTIGFLIMGISPYTHKRVKHSEDFVRRILKEEINPIKNNVSNHLDVDIMTNKGMLDVQYTSTYKPFVDFISSLTHIDNCVLPDGRRNHKKFWSQVNSMNKDIKVFQSMGYSIKQIYHCLGAYAGKEIRPGKFMNERYDYVAYVKYFGKTFDVEDVKVLDLKRLRECNANIKNLKVAFNLKNKENSFKDLYHSAYICFPEEIIKESTVTEEFLDLSKLRSLSK